MNFTKFVNNIPVKLKYNDFYFLLKLVGRISPKLFIEY
jgi:hypothetical protein